MWSGSTKPKRDKSALFSALEDELKVLPPMNKLVLKTDEHMICLSKNDDGKFSLCDLNNAALLKFDDAELIVMAASNWLNNPDSTKALRYIEFDKDVDLRKALDITHRAFNLNKSVRPKPGGSSPAA